MADILDAINQAAELAATIGGRPTVFTAGPRLTAALTTAYTVSRHGYPHIRALMAIEAAAGTAGAMRRLGLPHPWAPNERIATAKRADAARRYWEAANGYGTRKSRGTRSG